MSKYLVCSDCGHMHRWRMIGPCLCCRAAWTEAREAGLWLSGGRLSEENPDAD